MEKDIIVAITARETHIYHVLFIHGRLLFLIHHKLTDDLVRTTHPDALLKGFETFNGIVFFSFLF